MTQDKTIVYIFFTGERTLELCSHSFRKLGYKNIKIVDGSDSFKDKYVRAARDAVESGKDYFIRTDADRIVFSGLNKMVKLFNPDDPCWIEGQYFDYFMNRNRGGTPHLLPYKAMKILAENPDYMPNSKKPESDYSKFLKENNLVKFNHTSILTNLHDYEQYPSKVCNTFLNRLKRGHSYLYDLSHLTNNIDQRYAPAIQQAVELFNSNQYENADSMNFMDFSELDRDFPEIIGSDIESVYFNLENLYNKIVSGGLD